MVSHIFHFLSHRRRRRSYHSLPKKKKKRTSSLSSYLPDECWECIFKFININNDGKSLSLVSKQLLSITNTLRLSLSIKVETLPLLPCLFKRFTNLTSLDLTHFHDDDKLNLCRPQVFNNNQTNFINPIHSLLSKYPSIQHLKISYTYFLNDQHVVDFSLYLGNLVSVNLNGCHHLTETTLFSLLKNCPLLSEIRMEDTNVWRETEGHPGVCPQLKSLYLGRNTWLSKEMMILIASIFPNLQLLDLHHCYISKGICEILRKCGKLKHLNLAFCPGRVLHGMNFVVPELEVLNLSNTQVKDEALYAISKNCCGLLQLQLDNCKNVTEEGVKHVVENCTQLREINLGDIDLSDENRELLSLRGCHIC